MLNYYLINKDKYKNHSDSEAIAGKSYRNTMLFGAYVLIIIIGQFFINLNLTAQMCHKAQGYQTLTITVVPWMVIFGVFNLLLSFFPGWLKPFSNTFGYFFYIYFRILILTLTFPAFLYLFSLQECGGLFFLCYVVSLTL